MHHATRTRGSHGEHACCGGREGRVAPQAEQKVQEGLAAGPGAGSKLLKGLKLQRETVMAARMTTTMDFATTTRTTANHKTTQRQTTAASNNTLTLGITSTLRPPRRPKPTNDGHEDYSD